MKDILFCEYLIKENLIDNSASQDYWEVMQPMSDGKITIDELACPLMRGSLYYIDSSKEVYITPENGNDYLFNRIAVSKDFMLRLAESLECADLLQDIFAENGGFYVPLKNFKSVDKRFSRMSRHYQSDSEYSKALIVSDLIALINYAVYNKLK